VSGETDPELYEWRRQFYDTCKEFGVKPAEASVQFALRVPGVTSVALNTTDEKRVSQNLALAHVSIPTAFWQAMESRRLI
jgi:D-threo-aldose 1-dehydrogenase